MQVISVIIPVLNEERNIYPVYQELKDILEGSSHEIIFVDDGSTDRSYRLLKAINKKDSQVKVIKLRKNFGKSAALQKGLDICAGNFIITMDADGQDCPSEIPNLLNALRKHDLVVGWRAHRKDSAGKKLISSLYNLFGGYFTGLKIHDANCGFKAMTKAAAKSLDIYGEMHRYIPALLHWKGFKVGEIPVEHRKRLYGKSKYDLSRILKGFFDLLIIKFWMQYSTRPMYFFGGLGSISFIFGFAIGLQLSIEKLFLGAKLSNRPLLLLAILLIILGVQLFVLGFLADIVVQNNRKLISEDYMIKEFIK